MTLRPTSTPDRVVLVLGEGLAQRFGKAAVRRTFDLPASGTGGMRSTPSRTRLNAILVGAALAFLSSAIAKVTTLHLMAVNLSTTCAAA
jgi:hypothetical protein